MNIPLTTTIKSTDRQREQGKSCLRLLLNRLGLKSAKNRYIEGSIYIAPTFDIKNIRYWAKINNIGTY